LTLKFDATSMKNKKIPRCWNNFKIQSQKS